MSCYEWERGTIKLSVKEYGRVKKAFVGEIKNAQQIAFDNANKLYDKIMAELKGRRGVDVHSTYHNCQHDKVTNYNRWGPAYDEVDLDSEGEFYRNCLNHENRTKRPLKPKKKDYFKKIDRKKVEVDFEDADIEFNDSCKSIGWNVSENNHAKERAHDHHLAKVLFKLLGTVKWTRGTGGTIVGNDEYNQDTDYAGGGGNYITDSYGPLGKEERRHALAY